MFMMILIASTIMAVSLGVIAFRRRPDLRNWSVSLLLQVVAYALFSLLKATVGIRVTEEEELVGLDLSEHGISAYTDMEYPLMQRMPQTLPVMEKSLQLDEETASPV